jgi:hypothetical protein
MRSNIVRGRGYKASTGAELLDVEEMSERTGYSAYIRLLENMLCIARTYGKGNINFLREED